MPKKRKWGVDKKQRGPDKSGGLEKHRDKSSDEVISKRKSGQGHGTTRWTVFVLVKERKCKKTSAQRESERRVITRPCDLTNTQGEVKVVFLGSVARGEGI